MHRLRPTTAAAAAVLLALVPTTAAHAASTSSVTKLTARGSIGQAYVLNARKGAKLVLKNTAGKTVASGRADRLGSLILRDVKPGSGYRVTAGKVTTKPFKVLRAGENPPAAFYRNKPLKQGLNYIQVRDGVELAMTVRLPAGKTLADGPFPTVIEYSGYQVAAPGDLFSSIVATLTGGSSKPDPLVPASGTAVGSVIGPLLNFAVVSVQMRGSGCSGGAFDLFDLPTTYDGYDAVETVAAQNWVKGGKVGLFGISFSGITQLFTAGTRPPHLAAIAPMSVTDDTYLGTGFPGGIFNSGFAKSWVTDRMNEAKPAPGGGQPWAIALTKAGDKHCIANQGLRLQTEDALALQKANPFRTPALFARRAGGAWIPKINVPTFLVGQYQDEQTGGHFPESLAPLNKNPRTWITLQNGVHADSLGPSTITRWVEFLNLYVADQVPAIPPAVVALSGELYKYLADAAASPVLPSRFDGRNVTLAEARAEFEKDPRVRLLMDNGAGPAGIGSIGATWEIGATAWPVPQAKATRFYLGPDGKLVGGKPAGASAAAYTGDPSARPIQTLPGSGEGDAWKAQPAYTWAPVAPGKGLGWTTPALTKDVIIAGASSVDLYLKSSAKDTDLQVTLSEVRPDGAETYVQNGWLRASHRKLDVKRSTQSDPVQTHLKEDAAPMPAGYTLVRVPVFPVSHAFRTGSRIRVTVMAPGGDRPRWRFATIEKGSTKNTVSLGGAQASSLVLSVIEGADAKGTPLPPATALRGQPSRAYAPASNGG